MTLKPLIAICFSIITLTCYAQEKSTGIYKTSKDPQTVMDACLSAGKSLKYGSTDLQKDSGTVVLWKYFFGGNDAKLQIFITIKPSGSGSTVTMVMPKLPNVMGSFEKEIKKYASQVRNVLGDLDQISLSTGIE